MQKFWIFRVGAIVIGMARTALSGRIFWRSAFLFGMLSFALTAYSSLRAVERSYESQILEGLPKNPLQAHDHMHD